PAETKPADTKPAETKPAETKPPEPAPEPPKVAETKPPAPAPEPPKPVEEVKAPEPKPTPTSITPPPPAPTTAHFQSDSDPPGADVFRDGTKVGKTPLATDLPPHAGKAAFVVKLKGYKDATVDLPGDKGGKSSVKLAVLADEELKEPPKQPAIKVGQPPKKGGKSVKDGTINPFAK